MASLSETFNTVKEKLHFGKHQTMQRFGIIMAAFAASGAMLFVATFASAYNNTAVLEADRSMYSTQFTFSKSEQSGEVYGVYGNSDRTRALLMLKVPERGTLSMNAENYEAYITGSNPNAKLTALKYNPQGAVYMFGTTGYMGVLLSSTEPIPGQVVALTIRASSEIAQTGRTEGFATLEDESFKEYDQARIFFNPGAEGVEVLDALNDRVPDVRRVFAQSVVKNEEEAIREDLDRDLLAMKTQMSAISDYTERLTSTSFEGANVEVPATPEQIAGDKIEGEDPFIDSAGNFVEPGTLRLSTDTVVDGGVNFDWRNGSVEEGYLAELVPHGTNYATYLGELRRGSPEVMRINTDEWAMSDGTTLGDLVSANVAGANNMMTSASLLASGFRDFYSMKTNYQTNTLVELLDLEMTLRDVTENYTVNSSDYALRVY